MDEFWIEKVLKYIREHRAFNNVPVIQHGKDDESIMALLQNEWVNLSRFCSNVRQHTGQDFETKIFFIS